MTGASKLLIAVQPCWRWRSLVRSKRGTIMGEVGTGAVAGMGEVAGTAGAARAGTAGAARAGTAGEAAGTEPPIGAAEAVGAEGGRHDNGRHLGWHKHGWGGPAWRGAFPSAQFGHGWSGPGFVGRVPAGGIGATPGRGMILAGDGARRLGVGWPTGGCVVRRDRRSSVDPGTAAIYIAPPPIVLGLPAIAPPPIAAAPPPAALLGSGAALAAHRRAARRSVAAADRGAAAAANRRSGSGAARYLCAAAFALFIGPPVLTFATIGPGWWHGGFITGGFAAVGADGGDNAFRPSGFYRRAVGFHGRPRGPSRWAWGGGWHGGWGRPRRLAWRTRLAWGLGRPRLWRLAWRGRLARGPDGRRRFRRRSRALALRRVDMSISTTCTRCRSGGLAGPSVGLAQSAPTAPLPATPPRHLRLHRRRRAIGSPAPSAATQAAVDQRIRTLQSQLGITEAQMPLGRPLPRRCATMRRARMRSLPSAPEPSRR